MKIVSRAIVVCAVIGVVFLTATCGSESSGFNGSCVQQEPDSDLTYCYEKEEADSTFKTLCTTLGGAWSAEHCDDSQYARKCRQELQESTNGGPEKTVHYIYYFKSGSDMVCLGEETLLDCLDRDCPGGFVCMNGMCQELACQGTECQEGTACAAGECYPKDCQTRNCPAPGEVCIEGECIPAGCAGVECPEGQRCAVGRCYAINCATKNCAGYGNVCDDEECVENNCVGVLCPQNQVCADGYCYPADCMEGICAEDELCIGGVCHLRSCVNVTCQQGFVCDDGWCKPEG